MALIATIIGRCVLPMALLLNPILLARCSFPRADREQFPLVAALWALVLQPVIALIMHVAGIPIVPLLLALVHCVIMIAAVGCLRARRLPPLPAAGAWPHVQLLIFAVLAVLVFPFTHLTGIDPYKWGDLATNLAIERSVSWLVHPTSLLGFTPRSLASLHPLLMGSIRVLGTTGIESAFCLSSLVICAVGVTSAHYLATQLGMTRREAGLYTAFYAVSPMFIRYVHWGTGRGAFLAVLPLFIAGLVSLSRARGWWLALLSGVLLVLSHKTGLIALAVLPIVGVAALLSPRPRALLWTVVLLISFAASVCFAPPRYVGPPIGWVAGWLRYDLARFAWVSPTVLLMAILSRRTLFRSTDSKFMWLGMLAIFPLAHHKEMYPAMICLPFVIYAAMAALRTAQQVWPRFADHCVPLAVALSLCASLAIVVQRSIEATPPRFYNAAKFIEESDPLGPFVIAPASPWAYRIQGIVSGCPRFTVQPGEGPAFSFTSPPPLTAAPRQLVLTWVNYLRGFAKSTAECDWYGSPHTRYYVVEGEAGVPEHAVLVYNRDGIRIYKEALRSGS